MNKNLKLALALTCLSAVIGLWYLIPLRDGVMRQMWGLNLAHYEEFTAKVKARKLPQVDKRFSLVTGDSIPPIPNVLPRGGLHSSPLLVELSLLSNAQPETPIYFTRDGSVPTHRDQVYQSPIHIDTNTVLRFRILPSGQLPGAIGTEVYFIGEKGRLPIFSIVTDPVNLWNKYSGIYDNPLETGRSWEREAEVQYLQQPSAPLILSGAVRIHGGYSRRVPKKSFRFRFPIPESLPQGLSPILASTATEGENTLIVRAGGQSQESRIRDALSASLYARNGGLTSAFQPVELFLNATYWGVYDLRERIDLGYLRKKMGRGDYELLGFDSKHKNHWGTPILGKKKHWEKTLRYFKENSLSDSLHYSAATSLIDTENLFDYWIHNIYSANLDWPYNNFLVYRKTGVPDDRWKMIGWDMDASFNSQGKGLTHNTLEWAFRDRIRNDLKTNFALGLYEDQPTYLISTLFMRRFMENPVARDAFVKRFSDLLNAQYRPEPALALLDSIVDLTEPERLRDFARWEWKDADFRSELDLISKFIKARPNVVREHLAVYFKLGKPVKIDLELKGEGKITLNSITVSEPHWKGIYFEGMTLDLEAHPDSGATFMGWEQKDKALDKTSKIRIFLKESTVLGAKFLHVKPQSKK